MATSVFALSPSGTVFERFFNGIKWVYVRHELPGPRRLISVTTVASHGTLKNQKIENVVKLCSLY